MKNNFKTMMSAALAIGLLAAGCAKDGGDVPEPEKQNGEAGKMVLTVQTAASKGGTRAASENTGDASASELKVNSLKVAIFSASGSFVQWEEFSSLTEATTEGVTTYTTPTTDPIQLTADQSYQFIVFANDATGDEAKIKEPAANTMIETFIKTALDVTYTSGLPDIAKEDNFLIGTMWKADVVAIPSYSADSEIQNVEIAEPLGRLAAKIWVSGVTGTKPGNDELKGSFTAASYTIGSAALSMYNVGVIDGEATDPFTEGTIVTGNLHTAAYNSNQYTGSFNFKNIAVGNAEAIPANAFYAAENTSGRTSIESGVQNAQFYGNTTYIGLELKYTPLNSEVYTVDGNEVGAVVGGDTPYEGGPTFYTGIVDGQRLLFSTDPEYITGISNIKVFTDGLSYYAFPVQDTDEDDPVTKHRVLRNHFYEYTVTAIQDLGAETLAEITKDDEPIAEKSDVTLSVKVGKWDKVTNEIQL